MALGVACREYVAISWGHIFFEYNIMTTFVLPW